ncbi:MAG: hypothetical protein K6E47_09445 [Lachnospiraceae bacterium]|nr:hypothetical protein [Lachnospiraceae bacterium]
MKRISRKLTLQILMVAVLLCILVLFSSSAEVFASEDSYVSELDLRTQSAIAFSGKEYDGAMYYTIDNALYYFTYEMMTAGTSPVLYMKGVSSENDLIIQDGYLYYIKPYTCTLYRVKLGKKTKEKISKGVHEIVYLDNDVVYFWGKKKMYCVSLDDKKRICVYRNKNNVAIDLFSHTACIYKDMLFYNKSSKKYETEMESYDHRIIKMDIRTGRKSVMLDPSGIDGTFYFYEINGETFALSRKYGQTEYSVYKYTPDSDEFEKIKGMKIRGLKIIGADGMFLYAVDDSEFIADIETGGWNIYRIDSSWKPELVISVGKPQNAEGELSVMQEKDGYFVLKEFDDYPTCYLVAPDGMIIKSVKPWHEVDAEEFEIDSSDVDMVIKDGYIYVYCHSMGICVGARRYKI